MEEKNNKELEMGDKLTEEQIADRGLELVFQGVASAMYESERKLYVIDMINKENYCITDIYEK